MTIYFLSMKKKKKFLSFSINIMSYLTRSSQVFPLKGVVRKKEEENKNC